MFIYSLFLGLETLISFIVIYMLIERVLYFATLRHLPNMSIDHLQSYQSSGKLPDECPRVKSSALMDVIILMTKLQHEPEADRRNAIANWLEHHQAGLFYRLKWANFLAIAAFWIGFMGAVVTGFDALWMLSSTTPYEAIPTLYKSLGLLVVGTVIFVPGFLAVKAIHIWGAFYMERLKNALSMMISSGVILKGQCPHRVSTSQSA